MTKIGKLILPIFFILVITILSYSLFFGPSGYFSYLNLKAEVDELEVKVDELRLEEENLATANKLLDPRSIDPNYVADLLRLKMSWLSDDEILVVLPDIDSNLEE